MPRHSSLERPGWEVRIAPHTVDRWEIPETVVVRFEESRGVAIRLAVMEAHVKADVAPRRSLSRISHAHATATRLHSALASA